MIDFRSPLFLILLAAIPILIFIQLRTRVIASKWRKRSTILLRVVALLCAILALANLQRIDREQRLAVAFLLDTSDSIPSSQHEIVLNQINSTIANLKPTDQFSVIGFAQEASILIEMGPVDQQELTTTVLSELTIERDATDILASLKRTLELLPDNYHRRIVLFSDGIHNAGNSTVNDFLPLFGASNVEILTVPLQTVEDTIRVQEIQLPDRVRKGQRFPIQAIVETDGSMPSVTATLYRNGVPLSDDEFSLQKGKNVLTLPTQQIWEDHPQTYHMKLNINDEVLDNNQAFAVVQVLDKPKILYAEGDFEHAEKLKKVLEENGYVVKVVSAVEIPTELVTLQQNDVLILSNISADALSSEQLNIIETYVRDLGHGVVVIGGDQAFGAGGYTDTVLERVLPVEMTPRERQESVALVFVIDTSGSMATYVGDKKKIELAIEAIRAGIRNLEEEDQAAIIGFDVDKRDISPLTSEHDVLIRAVGRLKPTGGTTAMAAAIETAGELLKSTEAKRKHIILLSDGKSGGDQVSFLENAKKVVEARIGITVIGIGDADERLLQTIEEKSLGRSIHVKNVRGLPKVLMDAVQETQSYIVQEPFQPIIGNLSTVVLEGITVLPQLNGYVATAEKSAAQVLISSNRDEPVLANWHYGLGKTVAWTSDVKPAWSEDWISWQNFGKFWGQMVNWVLPNGGKDVDFDLLVSSSNGSGHIVIETQQSSSTSYLVQVAGPNGASQSVNLQQESSNRFVGSFTMHDSGSYIVTAKREDDGSMQTETITVSYPAEYASFDVNSVLLKQLADGTGGIYQPTVAQIAAPAGKTIEKQVSLSQTLLIIAVVLFVLEMILRRFSIAIGYLSELRAQLRRQTEKVVPGTLTQLTQKKEQATAVSISDVYSPLEARSLREHIATDEGTPETVSLEPREGTVTRLLAVKRRSQSV